MYIFIEKGKGISLHTFLNFDELLHILRQFSETDVPFANANSMLHQKTCHFLLSEIRAISVKITYSTRNHCWIISQIQIKLLSSGDKAKHNFFRFVLASKFSFFLSFFFLLMKWTAPRKEQRRKADVKKKKKIDCVATYLILRLPMISFVFAIRCWRNNQPITLKNVSVWYQKPVA